MSELAVHLKVGFNKEKKPLLERSCYVKQAEEIDVVSTVKACQFLFGRSVTITLEINGV